MPLDDAVWREMECINSTVPLNFISVLQARIKVFPNGLAARVLDANGSQEISVNWDLLYRTAVHVGNTLTSLRVSSGDSTNNIEKSHAIVLVSRNELLELLVGLLGCWIAGYTPVLIAVPTSFQSIGGDDPVNSLDSMIRHAKCSIILATSKTRQTVAAQYANRASSPPSFVSWCDPFKLSSSRLIPPSPPDQYPGVLIYVPGSSGELKLVSFPHTGLISHAHSLLSAYELSSRDCCYFPIDFRFGFPFQLLLSMILVGAPVVVCCYENEHDSRLMNYLTQQKATITVLSSSFAFHLRAQEGVVPNEEQERLRLVLLIAGGTLHGAGCDSVIPPRDVKVIREKLGHFAKKARFSPLFVCPELGGIVLSSIDCYPDTTDLTGASLDELFLDRMSLYDNRVVLIESLDGTPAPPGSFHVTAGGLALPGSSVCIVKPDHSKVLVEPNVPGEIYFRSPFLNGAEYYGQPKATNSTFRQRLLVPNTHEGEDGFIPLDGESDWVRTGYYGCLVDGAIVVVLGRVRDYICQNEAPSGKVILHFPADIATSVHRLVKGVDTCIAVSIPNKADLCLPVVILETARATAELPSIATSVLALIQEIHRLDCFAVLCVSPGGLPRFMDVLSPAKVLRCLPFLSPSWVSVHSKCLPFPPTPVPLPSPRTEPHVLRASEVAKKPESPFRSITDVLISRMEQTPDMQAYILSDANGMPTKVYTWRKLCVKVSALTQSLTKRGLRKGDHVLLMYAHGIDYVVAMHTCFYCGFVPIPLPPPDIHRLQEDIPAMLAICQDFDVVAILCNSMAEDLLRSKQVSTVLKKGITENLFKPLPPVHNTAKLTKTVSSSKPLGSDGLRLEEQYVSNPEVPALLHAHFDAEMTRIVVKISHVKLVEQCVIISQALDMTPNETGPLLSSVRTYHGLGLLFAIALGPAVGAVTVLLPPFEFARAPRVLFDALKSYHIQHAYVTWPMLEYAIDYSQIELDHLTSNFPSTLKRLIVAHDSVREPPISLERCPQITTVLGRPINSMITGGCSIDPPLIVDAKALRHGRILRVDTADESSTVALCSAGSPAPGSLLAVVDPTTSAPFPLDRVGELIVAAPMNADGEVRLGTRSNGPALFVNAPSESSSLGPSSFGRTGELAVLHDGKVFTFGKVSELLKCGNLMYLASRVEQVVESSHPAIAPGGAVVFLSPNSSRLVVVIELLNDKITADEIRCSVPAICLTVYLQNSLVLDSIVFLAPGRSHLKSHF
jgi:acyl-CoA synthetase (AMP-forming)/AMP-acid ligase II